MQADQDMEASAGKDFKPVAVDQRKLTEGFFNLSGSQIMKHLFSLEDPGRAVLELPVEDFYWVMKRVGEEDAITLLRYSSEEQRQYLLDLEIWAKDRLDRTEIDAWMARLSKADAPRLARWLFQEGQALAHHYLFKSLDIVITENEDDAQAVPNDFFSLDGNYHVRIREFENQEALTELMKVMAKEDLLRYQKLLLNLTGVIPAELEEDMYRMRNVRLAEHGFLPFEEAVSVYSPLDPHVLEKGNDLTALDTMTDTDRAAMAPLSFLRHSGEKTMLAEALSGLDDPFLLDRIRLEFAALCNQILSADRLPVHEGDDLIGTCRKAAGYASLCLERLCGRDLTAARATIQRHPLVSLFRVGFGLALKIKWETERWIKESWFLEKGLSPEFWGDPWGRMLSGLMAKKPLFYSGPVEEVEYRHFQKLSELGDVLEAVQTIMVLDGLLEKVESRHPMKKTIFDSPHLTFQPLLFNLWARLLLKREPSVTMLPFEDMKRLLQRLRGKEKTPPYQMPGYNTVFVETLAAYAADADPEAASILRKALHILWEAFREEYAWVATADLDERHMKFFLIEGPGGL